jgi:hypothetical protein
MSYHWRNAPPTQSVLVGWQIVLQRTSDHRKRGEGLISFNPLGIPLPKRVEFLVLKKTSQLITNSLP